MNSLKSYFVDLHAAVKSIWGQKATPAQAIAFGRLLASLACAFALLMSNDAFADFSTSIPFINSIGCGVVTYMKGPLAILIFIVVVVSVFMIGMIAKMDWGRIITVAVIYGILQGIVTLLASAGVIAPAGCM